MMKRIAQAWAFASILLLPNYADLTSGAGDARMRSPVALTGVALAQLTDMAIVALAFFVLMEGMRRLSAWPKVRWAVMALLPVLLFARNLDVMPMDVPPAAVLAMGIVWTSLLIFFILRIPRAAAQLSNAGSSLLAGFAVFALVMTFQLGRATIWRPGPKSFSNPIAAPSPHRPRLVWILFDELAYQPVFETRDPTLKLPNFDRLRAESTLYSDATPIAYRTTRAVPSLMLGRAVTDVTFTADNRYLVQLDGGSDWAPFDTKASLFGIAKQHGLSTSIVGWYVAYCPIFVGIVTDCYWSNGDAQDRGPTSTGATFAQNVWFPLRIIVEQALAPRRAWADVASWNAKCHIAAIEDLREHELETIANSEADILYLHIPAPHPPAFWSRRTGTFAEGGSYLDSLDYSDRLLGEILDTLEKQPRWADTTVIVNGDHSWRTEMWRPLPGWSAEDERASHGGRWDPRPLVMIHRPGKQSAQTVAAPTSIMVVHDRVALWIDSATP
jgi:hypothetical protein